MLYSKEKSFLFIHIPKTAGTSIRSVLAPYSGRSGVFNFIGRRLENHPNFCYKTGLARRRTYDAHITYQDIENVLPKSELERLFKFCITRNPYDRAYSYYLHVLNHPNHTVYEQIKSYGSFRVMLEHLEEIKEPSQKSYIINSRGEISVDFVGSLEDVSHDFREICKSLDIPLDLLPRKNSRKHKDYRDVYDNNNWRYIADYYEEDFELFGYEKNFIQTLKTG